MKSFISKVLVLVSALILVSCQNDLDETLNNGLDAPKTKSNLSASSVPSVLSQLEGIPVNIKLKSGNRNYSYLSTNKKNAQVDLHSIDDGSLKQRWLIGYNGRSISVEGGAYTNGYIYADTGQGNLNPKITSTGFDSAFLQEGPIESSYYICALSYKLPSTFMETYYLYSVDAVNRGILFEKESKTGDRHIWEIIPVETFTLTDVSYFMDAGDRIDSSLVYVRNYSLDNRGFPNPANHKVTISEKYETFSQFTEVKGLKMTNKISNSASVKIGIPLISIGGGVDWEKTTEKSWSYSTTQSETKQFTFTDEYSIVVPANLLTTLQVYKMNYNLNVSYVGTLVGNTTGRKIKLKGKWSGSIVSKFVYKPVTSNSIMSTIERDVKALSTLSE